MHVAFYTDHIDEMMDFYVNKMGFKIKVLTRYKQYLGREKDRPAQAEIARKDPERIFNVYIEIAEGQYIELFPAMPGQKTHSDWNEYKGYSHFAVTVDDIFAAYDEVVAKGIFPLNKPSKGPSGTYQFWIHDPDWNWFEIMQYTPDSYQVNGHLD